LDQTGYDVGLMHEDKSKTSWERVTILNDFGKLSYGFDGNVQLFKVDGVGFSIMGDASSVHLATDVKKHTDGGIGGEINFLKTENLFVIFSDRGINEGKARAKSQRFGYEHKGKELGAFLVDHQDGWKAPVYSGFWGSSNFRLISIYDPDNIYNTKGKIGGTLVSQVYLSFGNGGLPAYTIGEQLSTEFIESARTNLSRINSYEDLFTDSSNTYRVSTPPMVYLNIPENGLFSDFGKLKYDITPADRGGKDIDAWNGFMVRIHRGVGLGFLGEFTKDSKDVNHMGGGIGLKVKIGEGKTLAVGLIDQTAKLASVTAGINF
jgi:hypothetical protein